MPQYSFDTSYYTNYQTLLIINFIVITVMRLVYGNAYTMLSWLKKCFINIRESK